MEKRQANTESMLLLTQLKLSQRSAGIVTEMAGVADAVTELQAKILVVQAKSQAQGVDRTGDAVQKAEYREAMMNKTFDIAARTKSYALNASMPSLVHKVDFTRSYLAGVTNLKCSEVCTSLHNLVLPLVADLVTYGVTLLTLADLQTSIDLFDSYNPIPRDGINIKKAATEAIAVALNDCQDSLRRIDASVSMLENSHRDFFIDYFNARKIVETGGRRISLRVHVMDENGAALEKVRFVIRGMDELKKKTSKKGNFNIPHLEAGTYRGIFSKFGFVEQVAEFFINDTERTEVEVKMKAVEVVVN